MSVASKFCVRFVEYKIEFYNNFFFLSLIFIKLTDEEEIRFSETDDENDVDYLSPADTGSSSDSLEFDSETEEMERNTKVKIN